MTTFKRLFLGAFLLVVASTAKAADGTLSLSPAVITLRGNHGESTTQTLTIHNGTSQPIHFEMAAQDLVVGNGTRRFVKAGEVAGSIAQTAAFSTPSGVVAPGESASVKVTVTLPTVTTQRAVVVLFRGTVPMRSFGVKALASLGTLLTFTASDAVAIDLAPPSVHPQTSSSNLGFEQWCSNSGTEPVVARGTMAVIDARGALVGRLAIDPRRLLPSERVKLSGEYAGDLSPGHYRLLLTYDYEGRSATSTSEIDVQ
jgi:hypothetical protein